MLYIFDTLETIILWIGIWGIAETLINKYVGEKEYNRKMLVYIIITFIGISLYYSFINNDDLEQSRRDLMRKQNYLNERIRLNLKLNKLDMNK